MIVGIIALLVFSYHYAFAEKGSDYKVKLNDGLEMEDDIYVEKTWKIKVKIKKIEPDIQWLNYNCRTKYTGIIWYGEFTRCQF